MGPLSLDYYADGCRFETLTNKKDGEFSAELSDYTAPRSVLASSGAWPRFLCSRDFINITDAALKAHAFAPASRGSQISSVFAICASREAPSITMGCDVCSLRRHCSN
jgi:hypothetical protein